MGGAAVAGIAPVPWALGCGWADVAGSGVGRWAAGGVPLPRVPGRPLHRGRRGSPPMPRAAVWVAVREGDSPPVLLAAGGVPVPWLAVRGATGATGAARPTGVAGGVGRWGARWPDALLI